MQNGLLFFQPFSLVIDPVEAKSKKQWKMTLVFGSVRDFLLSALYGTVRSMQRKSWRLLILASSCLCRPPIFMVLSALEFFYCTKQKTVQLYSSESVCDAFCLSIFYQLPYNGFSEAAVWSRSVTHFPLSRFSFSLSFLARGDYVIERTDTHMWQWTGKKWKGDDGIREWKEEDNLVVVVMLTEMNERKMS